MIPLTVLWDKPSWFVNRVNFIAADWPKAKKFDEITSAPIKMAQKILFLLKKLFRVVIIGCNEIQRSIWKDKSHALILHLNHKVTRSVLIKVNLTNKAISGAFLVSRLTVNCDDVYKLWFGRSSGLFVAIFLPIFLLAHEWWLSQKGFSLQSLTQNLTSSTNILIIVAYQLLIKSFSKKVYNKKTALKKAVLKSYLWRLNYIIPTKFIRW